MKIVQNFALDRKGDFRTHIRMPSLKADMVAAKKAGKPIILIGHSWGGAAILNLMNGLLSGVPQPDLVVTADPVGRVTPYLFKDKSPMTGVWVNITATKDGMRESGGNFVAGLWGKTSSRITNLANIQVNSPRVHEDFEGMLTDARVFVMIRSIEAHASSASVPASRVNRHR